MPFKYWLAMKTVIPKWRLMGDWREELETWETEFVARNGYANEHVLWHEWHDKFLQLQGYARMQRHIADRLRKKIATLERHVAEISAEALATLDKAHDQSERWQKQAETQYTRMRKDRDDWKQRAVIAEVKLRTLQQKSLPSQRCSVSSSGPQ